MVNIRVTNEYLIKVNVFILKKLTFILTSVLNMIHHELQFKYICIFILRYLILLKNKNTPI